MSSQDQSQVPSEKEIPVDGKRIRVGGLALDKVVGDEAKKRTVLRDAVSDMCSHYGRVKECKIVGNGRAALVTFDEHQDAEKAIQKIREKKGWNYAYNNVLRADWSDNDPAFAKPRENRAERQQQAEGKKKVKYPAMPLSLLTPKNPATTTQQASGPRSWEVPTQQKKVEDVAEEEDQKPKAKRPRQRKPLANGTNTNPAPAGEQTEKTKPQNPHPRGNKGPNPKNTAGQAQTSAPAPVSAPVQTTVPATQAPAAHTQAAPHQGNDGRGTQPTRGRGGQGGRRGRGGQGGQGRAQGQNKGPSYKDGLLGTANQPEEVQPQPQTQTQIPTPTPTPAKQTAPKGKGKGGQAPAAAKPDPTPVSTPEPTVAPEDKAAPGQKVWPNKGKAAQAQPGQQAKAAQPPKTNPQGKGPQNKPPAPASAPAQKAPTQAQAVTQKQTPAKGKAANGSSKVAPKEDLYQVSVQKGGVVLHNFSLGEEHYQAHIKQFVH